MILIYVFLGCKEVEVPEEVTLAMENINEEVDYNIHVKKSFPTSVLVAMEMMPKSKKQI